MCSVGSPPPMPSPRGSDRGNFLTPSGEISCDPPQPNRVRREALAGPAIRRICRRLEFGLRLVGGRARGVMEPAYGPPAFRRPRSRPTREGATPCLIRSPRPISSKRLQGVPLETRAVKTASGPVRQILSGRQTLARAGMNGQRGEASGAPLGGESLRTRDERPSTLRTCACYG